MRRCQGGQIRRPGRRGAESRGGSRGEDRGLLKVYVRRAIWVRGFFALSPRPIATRDGTRRSDFSQRADQEAAMPFAVFRKHQRKLLAIFAILAMFGFVLSDSLVALVGGRNPSGRAG